MKKRISWKIGVILGLAAILSTAAFGVTYAANGSPNSLCTFSWVYSNDDGDTGKPAGFSSGIDPGDNGNDPREAQSPGNPSSRSPGNIASTTVFYTADAITFHLNNAYPGYTPTIFVGLNNQWSTPGRVQSINIQNPNPDLLAVKLKGIVLNQSISAGETAVGALTIEVGDIPPDSQSNSYSLSLNLGVSQGEQSGKILAIDNANLPNGQTGSFYQQTMIGTNGNLPYTWSISSGRLPPGLSLEPATGIIANYPASPGTYNFAVKLTDVTGDTTSANLSITILYAQAARGPAWTSAVNTSPIPAVVTPAAPTGNTAEIPPGGSTAEIQPTATAIPAVEPPIPALTPEPKSTAAVSPEIQATIAPEEQAGTIATPQVTAAAAGGAVERGDRPFITGILIVIAAVVFWLVLILFRRKRQKKSDA